MRTSFILLSATIALAACSDSTTPSTQPIGDTGTTTDTAEDTSEDTSEDTVAPDTGADTSEDATDVGEDTVEEPAFDEAAIFYECDDDSECEPSQGQEQICVRNVCVVPPTTGAFLSNDEGDEPEEHEELAPSVDCYLDGSLYEPAGETKDVTLVGIVERFGSGPTTEGLCVTLYDESALLPWLVNSECNLLADEDDELYIGCFELDPCRCQENFDGTTDLNEIMIEGAEAAMDAAGTPLRINSLDTCYSFIGYCAGIEDSNEADACRARVATNGLAELDSLVLGSVRTTEDLVDSALEDPEGTSLYEFPDVSTNWRFAVKVSGRANRWRDTWEYGLFTRGDLVREDDTLRIDATAVSAGAWATIPPAVGLAGGIDDTHGAVAGVIRDCGGADRNPWSIVHATVGISFNDSSVLAYFNGNPDDRLPFPGRTNTNVLGTYAAIDLPPGPNRVAPVICTGDCTDREDYIFAGAKNVFQTPKSVIIATFEGTFDLP